MQDFLQRAGDAAGRYGWDALPARLQGLDVEWFDAAEPAAQAALAARDINVQCNRNFGGNRVGLVRGCSAGAVVKLHFARGADNLVLIGPNSRMRGRVAFNGSRNLVINEGETAYNIGALYELRVNGNDCALLLEQAVTSNGCTMNVGHGAAIRIGYDCMFAHETMVYATDMHALVDLKARRALAPAKPVTLGRHVWLGRGSMVTKGVSIGDGSVIGAKSLVSRDVPACSVAAGVPAAVLRSDTSWLRKPHPREHEIEQLAEFLAGRAGRLEGGGSGGEE